MLKLHETQKCFFFVSQHFFDMRVGSFCPQKRGEKFILNIFPPLFLFLPLFLSSSFFFLPRVPIPYFNPSLFFFLPLVPIPSFTLLSFSFSLFSPSLFFLLPLFLVDQIYFCFLSRTRRLRIYKQREFKFF